MCTGALALRLRLTPDPALPLSFGVVLYELAHTHARGGRYAVPYCEHHYGNLDPLNPSKLYDLKRRAIFPICHFSVPEDVQSIMRECEPGSPD